MKKIVLISLLCVLGNNPPSSAEDTDSDASTENADDGHNRNAHRDRTVYTSHF